MAKKNFVCSFQWLKCCLKKKKKSVDVVANSNLIASVDLFSSTVLRVCVCVRYVNVQHPTCNGRKFIFHLVRLELLQFVFHFSPSWHCRNSSAALHMFYFSLSTIRCFGFIFSFSAALALASDVIQVLQY